MPELVHMDRPQLSWKMESESRIQVDQFDQYCGLYRARLATLTPRIQQRLAKDHPDVPIVAMSSLTDDGDERRVALVGMLVKRQAARPSVIKQLAESINIGEPPKQSDIYHGTSDTLTLEGDEQVVTLGGSIDVGRLVTGLVVGVVGKQIDGVFSVEHVVFPAASPTTTPAPTSDARPDDSYLIFVSGLSFTTGGNADVLIAAQSLVDTITGMMGTQETARSVALIVAGNSCKVPQPLDYCTIHQEPLTDNADDLEPIKRSCTVGSVECVNALDTFLAIVTPFMTVHVMPGVDDPTLGMLPQASFHRLTLPLAGEYGAMLRLVPNPYMALFGDNLRILGTSGECVDDVRRNTTMEDSVDIMRSMLEWQHIAPTAPDTLNAWPSDHDSFIIDKPIDVIFAGNQPGQEHTLINNSSERRGTLLLPVPSFSMSKHALMVNTRTLAVTSIDCETVDHLSI